MTYTDERISGVLEGAMIVEENKKQKEEDEILDKEEKRKKARLRTRGPYRKAHANW